MLADLLLSPEFNQELEIHYFEKLHAPVKGFYTFENSAHSPALDEPEKMQRLVKGGCGGRIE